MTLRPGLERTLAVATAVLCAVALVVAAGELGGRTLELDAFGRTFRLLDPRGLSVLALVPGVVVAALLSLADLPLPQRLLGALVRSALLASLGVALSDPVEVSEDDRISAVVLVDVSDSISDAGLARAEAQVEQLRKARGDHAFEVVTFAQTARRVPRPEGEDAPYEIARHGDEDGAGSDAAAALRLGLGLFEPGHVRRALLIGDGLDTRGHLLGEAERAAQLGVTLHAAPLEVGPPAEVGVAHLEAPARVQVGEPFHLQVDVFATRPTRATLRAYQGSAPNALDPQRELDLEAGHQQIRLKSIAHVPGPLSYRVVLEPAAEDHFDSNNRFEQTVRVEGSPRVLMVDPEPGALTALSRALEAGGFDVDLRSPAGLPSSATDLSGFDFCILSDTPIDDLSPRAIAALDGFVRGGGGLLVAGGEASFGLGGYRGSRLESLLPVSMDAERRRDRPTLAMALVIDKSGSMEGRKIRLAKEAARATAEVLGPEDYIGVIGFDARPQRVVRMQSAKNRLGVSRDVGKLGAGGGTAIFPALDAAYSDLSATRARIKHVILLTDGQTEESGLSVLVRSMRADGITVSTIGLGEDVNRSLLNELAKLGGGRAYFTASAHNIPRLFVRETHEVARSAAIEEPVRARATMRASFLQGVPVASAPPLRGYVATRLRPAPAQAVLRSDGGEPLLARMRRGLGWSLAWTSDLKPRWAVDWLRWSSFSRFISQLVRAHMRERPEADLPLTAELAGETLHVAVDALDGADRFQHGLEGTLRLRPRTGTAKVQQHALRETAPGRYTARVPLAELGTYELSAELRDGDRLVARASGHVAHPYPAEYASLQPAPEALAAAAHATGGESLENAEITKLFDAPAHGTERLVARFSSCVWLALGLFMLDLVARRVRLWPG